MDLSEEDERAGQIAARTDRRIRDIAMKAAPGMREHVKSCMGSDTTDEDIAIGLMARAIASSIVSFCHSTDQVYAVTKIIQADIANKVADTIMDGRPIGRLHS